jgi:hypothetical protein
VQRGKTCFAPAMQKKENRYYYYYYSFYLCGFNWPIIHARFILFNGGTEISIGLLFSIVVWNNMMEE